MKLKKLRKKVQQLEKRLREGPQKLARLRRRLQEAESRQGVESREKIGCSRYRKSQAR